MYLIGVLPLGEVLAEPGDDPQLVAEVLADIQDALGAEAGREVRWSEDRERSTESELDELDMFCFWGLRTVAAQLELHGSLDGFDPGQVPWEHQNLGELEDRGGSEKFPQLLHSDAELAAWVPAELPDVFPVALDDSEEDEDVREPMEEDEALAVGSLPNLQRELDALRGPLGMPTDPAELPDEHVFDADNDPLAPAKLAWTILKDRANEATATRLPLVASLDVEDEA